MEDQHLTGSQLDPQIISAPDIPSSTSEASETPDKPLANRIVRGGLWVAASSYFNIGFGFLANLLLTRILAPEHFGIFALASFFFSLINLRTKLGVGYALAQRKETTGELVGSHLVLNGIAATISLCLAIAAVPLLHALGYSWDVIWVLLALAVIGLSDSLLDTAWVLLDKGLNFGRSSLVNSLIFPISYIPAFWLAFHGAGYWSLVAQNGTFAFLLLGAMWWVAWRQLPQIRQFRWRFDRYVAIGLVRFGIMVGLANFAWMLAGQFDNFLVGTFVGLAALGFYDRAYRIAQWPSLLITGVISRTAFYTYARLQDDPIRLPKTVTMSLWLITTLALPLAVGIFASAPDLVAWLYGERWLPSVLILRFLVIYSVIRPLLDDAGYLFTAIGKPRMTLAIAVVEAVTLMVLGTVLTLAFGVLGTCVAVGITFLVGLVITFASTLRVITLRLWETLGLPVLATAVTLSGYLLLIRIFDLNGLPMFLRVGSKFMFSVGLYFIILFAVQPRRMSTRFSYVWHLLRGEPYAARFDS